METNLPINIKGNIYEPVIIIKGHTQWTSNYMTSILEKSLKFENIR